MSKYIGDENLIKKVHKKYGLNLVSFLIGKGYPYTTGWGKDYENRDALYFCFPHTYEVHRDSISFKENGEIRIFAKGLGEMNRVLRTEKAKRK